MIFSNKKLTKSDVFLRLITVTPFIPIIYFVFKGGVISALICLAIAAIMSFEVVTISRQGKHSLLAYIQIIMLMAPSVLIVLPSDFHAVMPPSYLLGMMILGLAYTAKDISAKIIMVSIAASLFSLISLIFINDGIDWLILAMITIISADTVAYFCGRKIGGPKLASLISPSKTWSGAICGVIAGGIAGYIVGYFFGFPSGTAILAGLLIADLSIGGDLMESWFKRRHKVKDSSSILPGHGGFLDRFDSFIFVFPALYLALVFSNGHG